MICPVCYDKKIKDDGKDGKDDRSYFFGYPRRYNNGYSGYCGHSLCEECCMKWHVLMGRKSCVQCRQRIYDESDLERQLRIERYILQSFFCGSFMCCE